ncbi:sensor histidine kinase [Paractinoplanes toevensis]|uniref:histidine kinase n=1 Tax=Paractinoplanes toevensis TaxID=571911 RepID=A0A919W4P2_9ACTN|nr:ATP-binding protein [Actinoplanes toevensis]GIM90333.1 two-component sensor histidine kinase [Actinoplanes toevensis]
MSRVRTRLTLLYTGLFVVSGATLLTIVYLLVSRGRQLFVVRNLSSSGETPPPDFFEDLTAHAAEVARQDRDAQLHSLLVYSAVALAIVAVLALVLGWLMAGRILRPLRTMTGTIQRISAHNVHDRLAATGPRDELKDLSDTVDGLLQRLEGALDGHRRFVANAAHELRTPLTVEHALIEEMLTDRTATLPQYRSLFERLLDLRQQQAAMLESLLTLAGSERGLDRHDHVELSAITERTVAAYRATARNSGVRLRRRTDPAWSTGDPALVERLVANLIDNAVAYNVDGGEVDVTTGVRDGRPVLTVTNTGEPIPAEKLDALFEPFQRLDRTGGRAGHHGLGLSIVRAIAVAHAATVDASPGPAGGLRIEVTFPGGESHRSKSEARSEPDRAPTGAASS